MLRALLFVGLLQLSGSVRRFADSMLVADGRDGIDNGMTELRPKAMTFGDSITEWGMNIPYTGDAGWVALIAAKLAKKVDIMHRGYSGFNTRKALTILPAILKDFHQPMLFATVMFGANDATNVSNTVQHVPVEEYESNLREILRQIKASGCEHLVVMGPPPVNTERWGDRDNSTMQLYAEAAQRAANGVAVFVDTYSALTSSGEWGRMTFDGLHPNGYGSKVLADAVMKALPAEFSDWKGLPYDFPFNNDVSNEDPAASLTPAALEKLAYPVRDQHLSVSMVRCCCTSKDSSTCKALPQSELSESVNPFSWGKVVCPGSKGYHHYTTWFSALPEACAGM